jgi:membrane-bound serine protease (ClpP class)
VLEIDGAIGPATAGYITREIDAADSADTGLIILRMNTPGGLDTSMREIIRKILASPIAVATYVAPSGARAASAGTYIVYASAVAAMAPGTNLGAATPIQVGSSPLPGTQPEKPKQKNDAGKQQSGDGQGGDTESRKMVNDAIAYIHALAELNGRNAGWAEDAVRTAASLPASQALKMHVVDVIADNVPGLLRKIDGRTVKVAGHPRRLATAHLQIVTVARDWRTELLATITDPNIALILMMIGVYGLIFEFWSPGLVAPGLIGSICLLLALYALSLLPIDYAGAALVLLGIGLMVAEVHIGSFGALGVGGIIVFIIGAIMMFPSRAPGFTLSISVVLTVAVVTAAFFAFVIGMFVRSRRRPIVTGHEALVGAEGETVFWGEGEGRVRVQGEIWRARASAPLASGAHVKVVGRDGLVLVVEPA